MKAIYSEVPEICNAWFSTFLISKPFHYPEFDETGVKILSRAGDTVNNMMMDITIYCLHVPKAVSVTVRANQASEVLVQSTANDRDFAPPVLPPGGLPGRHLRPGCV